MRREGRQHGFVRMHVIASDPSVDIPTEVGTKSKHGGVPMKVITKSKDGGVPTTAVFAKVPSKPTNHSKFTGRCTKLSCVTCHDEPVSKSKKQSKGRSKFKRIYMDEMDDVCVK